MSLSVLNSGGGGGSRVTLDGERVKELAMTSYQGDNPYTMGQDGMTIEANTLIKNALQIVNGVSRDGQYVWRILTAEGGDFVAFVTADDESAYPDGGTQDGYWYELVEEGVSGIDMGEITPSKDTTSISFPTSLTAVPSALLMYTATRSAGEYEIGMLFLTNHDMTASYGWYGIRLANSGGSLNKTIRNYVSYSNGSLKVDIGSVFSGSITYKWLAIV